MGATELKPWVYKPRDAARLLGMSRETLLILMRTKGYDFFPTVPGGKPGDRGNRWGLTEDQLRAIVKGESMRLPTPEVAISAADCGPDGKRRLIRRGTRRRAL